MHSVDVREGLFSLEEEFNKDLHVAFGELRLFIINHRSELIEAEINMLIDIFKNAIKNSELCPDTQTWIENRHSYFEKKSDSNKSWQKRFKDKDFKYKELMEFIEDIKEIKDYDFLLRIPEVTLRDEVSFTQEIEILQKTYISVIKDIADGKYR